MKTENLYNLKVSPRDLAKIPDTHRGLFVFSCLATTEIRLLLNISALSLASNRAANDSGEPIAMECSLAQTLAIERLIASKVYEYIRMTQGYIVRCERNNVIDTVSFIDSAKSEIDEILQNKFHETATWLRNKVSNHYIDSEIKGIMDSIDMECQSEIYNIYLHNKDGNSYYNIGEEILILKFGETMPAAVQHNQGLHRWLMSSAKACTKLHKAFVGVILEKWLSEKIAEKIVISGSSPVFANYHEIGLPVFWIFDESKE